ncbi:MAG: hypothetical protein HEQ38_15090 [Gemmatimonas sp.]|nr:hypothetical protein [Gemmatimonas sp.]
MFPLKRYAFALPLCALAACGSDRSVNPVVDKVDAVNDAGITSAGVVASYTLEVGQRVTIKPRTTTRTSRLRWSSNNADVASVNSTGTVTANSTGTATVTVSGGWVAENYTVVVTAPAPPPAPTVTAFTLQPAAGVSLLPGQTQQFAPAATWSDGQQYPLSVTYSATGGTISSTGLFTAGSTAGRFSVIATCVCGLVATSTVDVAQLTTLRISPKTVTLAAGATQQFATTALWSTGATTLPPISYSASLGTVSQSGLYTAPSTAGTYRVIVAHANGSARDTAVVTVGGGTGTGGGGTTTTQAGAMFFSDNFDNGQRNSANGFRWLGATEPTISTERAFSGSYAMRFQFNGSAPGGQAWSEERFDMGRYLSELGMEYMLYVPANYKHRINSNNKFLILWRDVYGGTSGTLEVSAETWRISDTESRIQFGSTWTNYNWTGNTGTSGTVIGPNSAMKPGQWNRIRFYVKAATYRSAFIENSGAADGVMKMWVNNELVYSKTNGDFNNFDRNVVGTTLRNGYLMGYQNSGFDQLTVFFIDDVKFFQGNPGW